MKKIFCVAMTAALLVAGSGVNAAAQGWDRDGKVYCGGGGRGGCDSGSGGCGGGVFGGSFDDLPGRSGGNENNGGYSCH